jgi:hypothetical protein
MELQVHALKLHLQEAYKQIEMVLKCFCTLMCSCYIIISEFAHSVYAEVVSRTWFFPHTVRTLWGEKTQHWVCLIHVQDSVLFWPTTTPNTCLIDWFFCIVTLQLTGFYALYILNCKSSFGSCAKIVGVVYIWRVSTMSLDLALD